MTFNIIETRAKSYKLQAEDGVTFFIMKRWMRADGSFTPSAHKAYEERVAKQAPVATSKRDEVIVLSANWESEKAIGIDLEVQCYVTDKSSKKRIFVPKSLLKNGGIPSWFFEKKIKELKESIGYAQHNTLSVVGTWNGPAFAAPISL